MDLDSEKEILLRKIIDGFDERGLIVSQAIFDANNECRYAIKKSYAQGLLTCETDPLGNETCYSYDANGNLTHSSRSNTGISYEYIYDLDNRLTSALEKDQVGKSFKSQVKHDQAGNKLLEIDRYGNKTRCFHDGLGRQISVTYPEVQNGRQSSIRLTYNYAYDLFDNISA